MAVVGGGFTGLSAALRAGPARRQRRGAGGRRTCGGRGLRAQRRPRQQRPRGRLRRASPRRSASSARAPGTAPTTTRSTRSSASSREEAIDCDFARTRQAQARDAGRRTRQAARSAERLVADGGRHRRGDPRRARACVPRSASDAFTAACCTSAARQMHMGRFAGGLAEAAERHGAQIHDDTLRAAARAPGQRPGARVHTARGSVRADQVLLATGATRHGGYASFGWLRRRIVPIGSFIVVTEPLGAERARPLLPRRGAPTRRSPTSTTTSASPPTTGWCSAGARASPCRARESDAKSGEILRQRHGSRCSRSCATCASTTAGAAWST